jgi:CO/xanthine dehydrogenase Mo-binding subunit
MDAPCFVEDIRIRQMLYACTLRSPIARGRLVSIECPRLPNSYTLIQAEDIPGKNRLGESALPVLAQGTLSYIGEPVALLVGPDMHILEDYASQCRVLAEEEPPVFAASDAVQDARAILAKREIHIGDTEAAFGRAVTIVRDQYRTGAQEHWYAEPVGAVAWFEQQKTDTDDYQSGAKGKSPGRVLAARTLEARTLAVHTATQWPFQVKRSVAQVLNLPAAAVQVQPTSIGLHMDGKIWYPSLIACHAALGAYVTKKPVRLMLTRAEDFRYSPKRNETEISIASALNDKGEITGTEIQVRANLGAYGVNAGELLDQTCLGSLGVYRIENISITGIAARTNIPPQGPFCGFGLAQGCFALERHISHIADMRKQNPVEWRKERFTGILPLGSLSRGNVAGEQLLDAAASMSDYYRKWAAYELLRQNRRRLLRNDARGTWAEKGETLRGIGIAAGFQGSGLLYSGSDKSGYSVELTLEKDGSLEIRASAVISNDDYGHVWADMAAEILSIDSAAVRIHSGINAPDSGPAIASRSITLLTRLVEQACLAIRKQRFRDPLPITVRRNVRPQKNPQWEEQLPPPAGVFLDPGVFARPGRAAAVVEVAIDPVEYTPVIRGVWLNVDGGKIISEERARKNLKITSIQALGWAGRERISYEDGLIPLTQLENYNISGPADIPPIHIDFIWNNAEDPKGIGDLPFTCIPAAYLQAVSQAMDHHFQSIPLQERDIWEAGKAKHAEKPTEDTEGSNL